MANADGHSYGGFKTSAAVVISGSLVLLVLAMVGSWMWSASNETGLLAVLFFLPVLVQFCGLKSLDTKFERAKQLLTTQTNSSSGVKPDAIEEEERRSAEAIIKYAWFYLLTMAVCLWMTNFLWIVYAYGQWKNNWEDLATYLYSKTGSAIWNPYFWASIFSLCMAALLLAFVMWMTRAVISGEAPTKEPKRNGIRNLYGILDLYQLRVGASQAPFLTLIFFLTVFLGVSYLFGFAFAFHDKTHGADSPAIVMRNLLVPKSTLAPTSRESIAELKFSSGHTTPINQAEFKQQTEEAAKKIRRAQLGNSLRITVEGGADLTQIGSVAYQSNYELAQARAAWVKEQLLEKLSQLEIDESKSPQTDQQNPQNMPPDLQWICLSRPNEGPVLQATVKKAHHTANLPQEESEQQRTVKVFLEENAESPTSMLVRYMRANHLRPLNLMDYIYFANYTITTTGYGDIVPNTNYAKFICSFANIAEVFFLVVFFNTLLSLVGRRASDLTSQRIEHGEQKLADVSNQLSTLSTLVSSMSSQLQVLHNKYGKRRTSRTGDITRSKTQS